MKLDLNKKNTMIAINSLSHFHGAIESSFDDYQKSRKLWRIDHLNNDYYLMILSEKKPDFTELTRQFGYENDYESLPYDNFLDHIKTGQKWRFRLVANPAFSKKVANSNRGKIIAEVSDKYMMDWLKRKAETNGFSIDDNTTWVTNKNWNSFKKNVRRVTFRSVAYEGILQVEDEALLKSALMTGIGREKAYGMGMLTLMRV